MCKRLSILIFWKSSLQFFVLFIKYLGHNHLYYKYLHSKIIFVNAQILILNDKISIFVFHIKLFWDHSSNGFSYFQSTNADVHHPFYIIRYFSYVYLHIFDIFFPFIFMHKMIENDECKFCGAVDQEIQWTELNVNSCMKCEKRYHPFFII